MASALDNLAGTAAIGAWLHIDKLPEKGFGNPSYLTPARAGGASGRRCSRFRAAAFAALAGHESFDLQRLFDTLRDFLQCQLKLHLQILAPPGAGAFGSRRAETEKIIQPAEAAEIPHKGAQGVGKVETAKTVETTAESSTAKPLMAVLIVDPAFLRIF